MHLLSISLLLLMSMCPDVTYDNACACVRVLKVRDQALVLSLRGCIYLTSMGLSVGHEACWLGHTD